jgi:hypothetical protein
MTADMDDNDIVSLEEALKAKKEKGADDKEKRSQANTLIDLAKEAELFHDKDGNCYADIHTNGHRETWAVRSKGFRRWLSRQYYQQKDGAPSSEAMQSALNVLEAQAHFDGPERAVALRVAGNAGKIYLDIGNAAWQVIEIDATGWRLITDPPIRFRRPRGMKPLPIPVAGGTIKELKKFINVRSNDDFVLVVAWALAALRDLGPYPVLALSGEQGSAKSTLTAILRALLDPYTAPLRALPREDRDLFIAATNGHILAFDNVSGIPLWISDTMCRLSTGGGFATRQLYSDQDEILFDAMRPQILNGIEDVVKRQDLVDRALFILLEKIQKEDRRSERELWASFNEARPRILGALLDHVSHGLRRLPGIQLDELPRMADFAVWATACETKAWPVTFARAYGGNQEEAAEIALDADAVATAVRAMMAANKSEWVGTATKLLVALETFVDEKTARSKDWPQSSRALSQYLRRSATCLRKVGIEVVFDQRDRTHRATRQITITQLPVDPSEGPPENRGKFASFASLRQQPNKNNSLVPTQNADAKTAQTQTQTQKSNPSITDSICASVNPLENKDCLRKNANNAKIPAFSNPDPFDCLKDPSRKLGLKPKSDDFPELPPYLRRNPSTERTEQ